jgi:hypothetical protein
LRLGIGGSRGLDEVSSRGSGAVKAPANLDEAGLDEAGLDKMEQKVRPKTF